jgi:hypothetical protein
MKPQPFADVQKLLQNRWFYPSSHCLCSPLIAWVGVRLVYFLCLSQPSCPFLLPSSNPVVPVIAVLFVRGSLAQFVIRLVVYLVRVLLHEPHVHLPENSIVIKIPTFWACLVPRLAKFLPRLLIALSPPTSHELDDLQCALISGRIGVAPEHLALGIAQGSINFPSPNPGAGGHGYSSRTGEIGARSGDQGSGYPDLQWPDRWRVPGEHEPQGICKVRRARTSPADSLGLVGVILTVFDVFFAFVGTFLGVDRVQDRLKL